jgi:hypothetical protein
MTDLLDGTAMERWQRNPISFIEEILWTYDIDSQGYRPFQLFDAQRLFLKYAWAAREDGRLLYPEQQYCTIKKTGKTAFAGAHVLTTTLILGGRNGEAYCVANDLMQSRGRAFDAIVQICKNSPYLQRECEITQDRIRFPQTGAVITAIPSSDTSIAGAHPVISSLDEIWGFSNTRLRRLYEELVPVPTRKISCRLVTSHAGYTGESTLLEEIYKDGLQLPEIGKDLHAGNSTLFFWSHDCIAPWQTEQWLADMRNQVKRPAQFIRQFENRFVASENIFIEPNDWDRCVIPSLRPQIANKLLLVWIGIDASYKHDYSAIVVVSYDAKAQQVVLIAHYVFKPTEDDPLNFERTIEQTMLDLHSRFQIRLCVYDPYMMVDCAQRLARAGIPMEEYKQTRDKMIAVSRTLYDSVKGQNIALYPDKEMRLAMTQTIADESALGWRIAKEKASARIDVIVALAMACHAAVKAQGGPLFDLEFPFGNRGDFLGDSDVVTKQQTEVPPDDQPCNCPKVETYRERLKREAEEKKQRGQEAEDNIAWRAQQLLRRIG